MITFHMAEPGTVSGERISRGGCRTSCLAWTSSMEPFGASAFSKTLGECSNLVYKPEESLGLNFSAAPRVCQRLSSAFIWRRNSFAARRIWSAARPSAVSASLCTNSPWAAILEAKHGHHPSP